MLHETKITKLFRQQKLYLLYQVLRNSSPLFGFHVTWYMRTRTPCLSLLPFCIRDLGIYFNHLREEKSTVCFGQKYIPLPPLLWALFLEGATYIPSIKFQC